MDSNGSSDVRHTLEKPDVHRHWEKAYRTPENKRFYDLAVSTIADRLSAPENSLLLDAGCGICDYSIRLASLGFQVVAVDFSEAVLKNAAANLLQQGQTECIHLQRENLLDLSFADESFDYILCWGVLMHIPEVARAISELCRVVKKGGAIVISEANQAAPEAVGMRVLKRLLGRRKEEVVRTPAGLEYWAMAPSGKLLTREADIGWLVNTFAQHELRLREKMAGQLTELYTRLPNGVLQSLLHGLNRFWFRFVRVPYLSFGVIIIFEK